MIETKEGFILAYLMIFILCFYIGNLTSARKRGRYLEQSIADIIPYLTFKIGFAIVTVSLFLYLCFLEKKEISTELFYILFFAFISLIIVELLLLKKNKKLLFSFFRKEENTSPKKSSNKNDKNKTFDSNEKKDMLAIMEVAICNGLLFMQILIIVSSLISLTFSRRLEVVINMVKSFGLGNCYLLMLFNSFLLLIFSCINFKYFFTRDNKSLNSPDDSTNIIKFIKSDVDN